MKAHIDPLSKQVEEAALIIVGLDPSKDIKFTKGRLRDPLSRQVAEAALIIDGLDQGKDI